MIAADKSKRSFFKKMAALTGFVAAAGYMRNLVATRSSAIDEINHRNEHDVNLQKKAWQQKKLVVMTDDDKKLMLGELLSLHNKNQA